MTFLESVQQRAELHARRIVFPEAGDDRTDAAISDLTARHLVTPILIEDPASHPRYEEFVESYYTLRSGRGASYDDARTRLLDPLFLAAMLVRHGHADGSVAGAVRTTSDVLRAAIHCVGVAPGIRTVSSTFYMVVPAFRGDEPEVLSFTDASVVPDPSAEQLSDIASAAADARMKIVGDKPRVAFLSFSTLGSAESASTEKVRAAVRIFRERRPDISADGELQVDAALIGDVARRKAPDSDVAGTANVLVFPNLDAGNIAYKLVQRLARAQAIGPILQGLAKPCNDLSRGATSDDIVNVACITALQASVGREQNLPPAGPVAQK